MSSASEYVYLDWAATAPLCKEAAIAMEPYLLPGKENLKLGTNPNSLHSLGRNAFSALEASRSKLALLLGAKRPDEIIFTSGATESNNAALRGIAQALVKKQRISPGELNIVVSKIEHEAILAPAHQLESEGYQVHYLVPNAQGFIELEALDRLLKKIGPCSLVSIQAANSELGSIQPIPELAALAHKNGALFHTDAVQALGKIRLNLSEWGVDAASFAAHKVGGPKGIGALYLKARTPYTPFLLGGGQESARRSGTQNPCAAAGFVAAVEASLERLEQEEIRLRKLRDYLYEQLCAVPRVRAVIPEAPRSDRYLANIVLILVEGLESETMILRLDSKGFCVSGGSACSSHSLEPSHVLSAVGIPRDLALGALRISMGELTTQSDVEAFVSAFKASLED